MLSAEDVQRISPYVSSTTAPVFALSGLPEEVIAVLFAYYSRARAGVRENLAKLLRDQELAVAPGDDKRPESFGLANEKARAFHEKWTVGYGHSSVAEHAVVHLAIEDVSIIASKAIEDMRLGSFTEKSTRYVVWGNDAFVIPEEIRSSGMLQMYLAACQKLFDTYAEILPVVERAISERSPRTEGKSEKEHGDVVRARALDVVRGLLPASAKTSLGLTANARALEGLLCKLRGNMLDEVRHIGREMQSAATTIIPTLLRHVSAAPNIRPDCARDALFLSMRRAYGGVDSFTDAFRASGMPVSILFADAKAAQRIACALAFEQSDAPWTPHMMHEAMCESRLEEAICRDALTNRRPRDGAPRAFEAANISFALEMDFGAWRDLQRHRMLSPANQRIGCALGYEVPDLVEELGLAPKYRAAIDQASDAWYALVDECGPAAQYVVPLAFKVRTLWYMNLRELIHVVELRTGPQGHASYRKIAQAMYLAACSVYPWLKGALRVDMNDYAMAR